MLPKFSPPKLLSLTVGLLCSLVILACFFFSPKVSSQKEAKAIDAPQRRENPPVVSLPIIGLTGRRDDAVGFGSPAWSDFFKSSSMFDAESSSETTLLEDDFNDNVRDPTKWVIGFLDTPGTPGPTVMETNQELHITPVLNASEPQNSGYLSATNLDFTESAATVEVVKATNVSTGKAATYFYVGINGNRWVRIVKSNEYLYFGVKMDGNPSESAPIPYDPVMHRFWRIRHVLATDRIAFETSPDNTVNSLWTEHLSVDRPFPITAVRINLAAGTYMAAADPGEAIFDNFVLAKAPLPTPCTLLSDNFNDEIGPPAETTKWMLGFLDTPQPTLPLMVVETNQEELRITPVSNASEPQNSGYLSSKAYDFTGAMASVKVVQATYDSATYFFVGIDVNNWVRIVKGRFGNLVFQMRIAGGPISDLGTIPYNATTHRWWRIRHSLATDQIAFETSPDNSVNSWTQHFISVAQPFAITAVKINLAAGTYSASATPGVAIFDNFVLAAPPATICGHLTYTNGSTPGKNVTMTLTGTGGFVTQTITDPNGDYSFVNIPVGDDYTLTPSKTGDNANGLESFDAAFAARYVAGLDIPTANQRIAADADGDGNLTSLDAAFIARRAAGLPGFGIVGNWKFSPVNRTYTALGADQTGQNFAAILVGDTSGDWLPAIPSGVGGNANQSDSLLLTSANSTSPDVTLAVTVSLPHVTGPTATNITVPITVGDLTGQGVKAYDLQVTFNPAIVQPQGTPFDTAGTVSSGMLITPNAGNPGHLIISAFQATDLTGSGTLINLKFTIVGAPGQLTPTTFEDYTDPGTIFHPGFRFNAGTPAATPANGSIHVNGPTAADGTVSGQIVDGNGNPVEGAAVRMSGTQNRLTVTDRAGNYHFDSVEAGGFYTVTPSRANYLFSPGQRSFSQIGQHTDAVFTASDIGSGLNPLDTTEYFVRQQYLDFLSREPDEAGLNFWVNNIAACGADSDCLSAKRIDTSAAFFISIEFEQTGYLVYRLYRSAYGDISGSPVPVRVAEFRPDTEVIGRGVVVNQSGWEAKLEANKQAFASEFVRRPRFTGLYPTTMTPREFVDRLFLNGGVTPGESDRAVAINEFGGASDTADAAARARAVRGVAENALLRQQEYTRAFVLMQYFGYLGRDPNTAPDTDFSGYRFWLNKLDSFNGDFRSAEMVKAFIVSGEYKQRFGP